MERSSNNVDASSSDDDDDEPELQAPQSADASTTEIQTVSNESHTRRNINQHLGELGNELQATNSSQVDRASNVPIKIYFRIIPVTYKIAHRRAFLRKNESCSVEAHMYEDALYDEEDEDFYEEEEDLYDDEEYWYDEEEEDWYDEEEEDLYDEKEKQSNANALNALQKYKAMMKGDTAQKLHAKQGEAAEKHAEQQKAAEKLHAEHKEKNNAIHQKAKEKKSSARNIENLPSSSRPQEEFDESASAVPIITNLEPERTEADSSTIVSDDCVPSLEELNTSRERDLFFGSFKIPHFRKFSKKKITLPRRNIIDTLDLDPNSNDYFAAQDLLNITSEKIEMAFKKAREKFYKVLTSEEDNATGNAVFQHAVKDKDDDKMKVQKGPEKKEVIPKKMMKRKREKKEAEDDNQQENNDKDKKKNDGSKHYKENKPK